MHAVPATLLVAAALAGCGGGSSGGGATAEAPSAGATQQSQPAQTQAQAQTGTTTAPAGGGADAAGARVFASAGCAGCHTLKAAGSSGNVGPNLDNLKPSFETVKTQVTNGGGGMPAFGGQLSAAQIADVARYVSDNAGR